MRIKKLVGLPASDKLDDNKPFVYDISYDIRFPFHYIQKLF